MKKVIIALAVAMSALPATSNARGEDLKNCRFSDGTHIVASLCDRLRQEAVENGKQQAKEEPARRHALEYEARKNEDVRLERERVQMLIKNQQQHDAEIQAKQDAEYAKYKQAAAKQEKIATENGRAKKERCGDDFGMPRIGMTLARAQECVEKFKLKGQINRSDGVVSIYMGSSKYLHVMDSRVVSWGVNRL